MELEEEILVNPLANLDSDENNLTPDPIKDKENSKPAKDQEDEDDPEKEDEEELTPKQKRHLEQEQ
jgi:hypothetical protein